jgi:hypothetical protein
MQTHFFHGSPEIRGNRMNDGTDQFHRDHEDQRHDDPGDDGGYAAKRCGHFHSPRVDSGSELFGASMQSMLLSHPEACVPYRR